MPRKTAPATHALTAGIALAGLVTLVLAFSGAASAHPPSILSSEAEKATIEEVKDFRKTISEAIEKNFTCP